MLRAAATGSGRRPSRLAVEVDVSAVSAGSSSAPGKRHPASFRDPSGYLFERDGVLHRVIAPGYLETYQYFKDSGLSDSLLQEGLLVPHREAELPEKEETGLVLTPEPLPFVSYPYEWCFSQLKAAALLTLELQERALEHGMSLKDASAFNVQFIGARPLLIDLLSFEEYREGSPWPAYGQFCRHFLAPLLLMTFTDVRLNQLARLWIDGIPLGLASGLLPMRTRLSPSIYGHLHLHARLERSLSDEPGAGKGRRVSRLGLRGIVDSLRSLVSRLSYEPAAGVWVNYRETHTYSGSALDAKKDIVAGFLERTAPDSVWDLGANVGDFSRLASEKGISAVSMDSDPGAVEIAYRRASSEQDRYLLPLVVDLTNPSPGLGWAHVERSSLRDRGPADMVLALALLHHLAIGNNVPLELVADWLADLGRTAIVEWVPKGDPQVQRILASRKDIFDRYTHEEFERAFVGRFDLLDERPLPESGRILYLMRRRR